MRVPAVWTDAVGLWAYPRTPSAPRAGRADAGAHLAADLVIPALPQEPVQPGIWLRTVAEAPVGSALSAAIRVAVSPRSAGPAKAQAGWKAPARDGTSTERVSSGTSTCASGGHQTSKATDGQRDQS